MYQKQVLSIKGREQNKKETENNIVKPHLYFGHYIWALVGSYVAEHIRDLSKSDQDN